jgi:hypothetical protein
MTHDTQIPQDCAICGWAGETIHTALHTARCTRWQQAMAEMTYKPAGRANAEDAIEAAHNQLKAATTADDRLSAAQALAQGLYDRSLGLAIDEGNHLTHPGLDDYSTMIKLPYIPAEFRARHPYQDGHIASGATVWEPEGSKARKRQFRAFSRV